MGPVRLSVLKLVYSLRPALLRCICGGFGVVFNHSMYEHQRSFLHDEVRLSYFKIFFILSMTSYSECLTMVLGISARFAGLARLRRLAAVFLDLGWKF